MSDEYERTIVALQRFKIDEILESSHGPVVDLVLVLPDGTGGERTLDIGMSPALAILLGQKLVESGNRKHLRKTPATRLPWQGIIDDPGSSADSLDAVSVNSM